MKKIITLLMAAFTWFGINAALIPASFPGGDTALTTYISNNLQYPPAARDNGIEGVVSVMFVVKPDGSIGNIKIKRMVDPDLESEAIRLVKTMPKWTPASDNGSAVESQAEIEVPFTIE